MKDLMNEVDVTSWAGDIVYSAVDESVTHSVRDLMEGDNSYLSREGKKVTGRVTRVVYYYPGIFRLQLTQQGRKSSEDSYSRDEILGLDNEVPVQEPSAEEVVEVQDWTDWKIRDVLTGGIEYPGIRVRLGIDPTKKPFFYLPDVKEISHS
tara:strand:+ start:544 stop:996 length:453 start_codon:yes stop_codon:yes gene_type:complete